jgi:hypothetical protein
VDRHSVISANHYETTLRNIKADTIKMMGGKPHGAKVELGTGALDPNNK